MNNTANNTHITNANHYTQQATYANSAVKAALATAAEYNSKGNHAKAAQLIDLAMQYATEAAELNAKAIHQYAQAN